MLSDLGMQVSGLTLSPQLLNPQIFSQRPLTKQKKGYSEELTENELAFLLFRVKEAAKVEDNGQKEDEHRNSDDRHRVTAGDRTVEGPTPELPGDVHLQKYIVVVSDIPLVFSRYI